MARKKSLNPRTKHIDTRLTEREFKTIKFKAAATGVTGSEYLRSLGMNYPLKSMVDQLAVDELIKTRADLGRVGGLLKKWLSEQEGKSGNLGSKHYKEIDIVVENIEQKSNELLYLAKKIMNKT
jgi:hypothetical protein